VYWLTSVGNVCDHLQKNKINRIYCNVSYTNFQVVMPYCFYFHQKRVHVATAIRINFGSNWAMRLEMINKSS
jgi:hypothetical protein